MARPTYDPDSLLVGVIGRPHGLEGEVTLRSYNSLRGADLASVPCLILERGDAREERTVRRARRSADGWLVRLEGVDSRDAAAALTHVPVRVQKKSLPPLGPGEFFVEDLLGCLVWTEAGHALGVVDRIFWNGAQDVMAVLRGKNAGQPGGGAGVRAGGQGDGDHDGESERLIPLVPAFVREVDAGARRVVVAWNEDD